jgi:F-type H+-transporting ATPase subunit delta
MTGISRALVRRYARALVSVATENSEDAALKLGDELRAFASLLERTPELRATLLQPTLRPGPRRGILTALAVRVRASDLLRRLLLLLADRDRLSILPALAEAYADQLNAERGIVTAEAVSALPLATAQRRALETALGKAATIKSRVDPAILGGLLVRLGGQTYDGTVRTQLATLRQRLAGSR